MNNQQEITPEDYREIRVRTTRFSMRRNDLCLTFIPEDPNLQIASVFLQKRAEKTLTVRFQVKEQIRQGKRIYSCRFPARKHGLADGLWDIVASVKTPDECYDAILGGQSTLRKYLFILFPRWIRTNDGNVLYPFVNLQKHFTIQSRKWQPDYDTRRFILKEYLALFCYLILKPYWDHKKYWLICEKYSYMAQDNGYYFFRYCMDNLPSKERKRIFFVLDPKSPDYPKLMPYQEQVADFMSFRYLILLNAAELLISSEAIRHFYIWDSPKTLSKSLYQIRKNVVFLQHGVMALKRCENGFHKYSYNQMALFNVSSPFEQDIIYKYFGYDRDEIMICGLPRWDALKDTSDPAHREILIMPTWREWLERCTKEFFLSSDYYQNYEALLKNDALYQLLEEKDLYLNFYIHPKFREYIDLFLTDNPRVRIIAFGDEPLNKLLMSCSLMITDYSSASWDVYYQGKPVLFWAFDKAQYDELRGSYLDMETDGFGDLLYTSKEVLAAIREYADCDFTEKEIYAQRRSYLLPYRDHNNSRRIYQYIKKTRFPVKFFSRSYWIHKIPEKKEETSE